MESDPSFFARNSDPATSREAAASISESTLYMDRAGRLLRQLDREEGWTFDELFAVIPPGFLGLCPWHRLSDLRRMFLAEWATDSLGNKIRRPGNAGRNQGAVRITNKGRRRYLLDDIQAKMENENG